MGVITILLVQEVLEDPVLETQITEEALEETEVLADPSNGGGGDAGLYTGGTDGIGNGVGGDGRDVFGGTGSGPIRMD